MYTFNRKRSCTFSSYSSYISFIIKLKGKLTFVCAISVLKWKKYEILKHKQTFRIYMYFNIFFLFFFLSFFYAIFGWIAVRVYLWISVSENHISDSRTHKFNSHLNFSSLRLLLILGVKWLSTIYSALPL